MTSRSRRRSKRLGLGCRYADNLVAIPLAAGNLGGVLNQFGKMKMGSWQGSMICGPINRFVCLLVRPLVFHSFTRRKPMFNMGMCIELTPVLAATDSY